MPISKGFRTLVDEATAEVITYCVDEVKARLKDSKVQIVDIREVHELTAGIVVGAFHAPRCMLEFWVDPASPHHKPLFADEGKDHLVLRRRLAQRAGRQDATGHGHEQRGPH